MLVKKLIISSRAELACALHQSLGVSCMTKIVLEGTKFSFCTSDCLNAEVMQKRINRLLKRKSAQEWKGAKIC